MRAVITTTAAVPVCGRCTHGDQVFDHTVIFACCPIQRIHSLQLPKSKTIIPITISHVWSRNFYQRYQIVPLGTLKIMYKETGNLGFCSKLDNIENNSPSQ